MSFRASANTSLVDGGRERRRRKRRRAAPAESIVSRVRGRTTLENSERTISPPTRSGGAYTASLFVIDHHNHPTYAKNGREKGRNVIGGAAPDSDGGVLKAAGRAERVRGGEGKAGHAANRDQHRKEGISWVRLLSTLNH